MTPTLSALAASVAARYGQMAAAAIRFHVQTGNPAELLAAYIYARNAAHFAAEVIE